MAHTTINELEDIEESDEVSDDSSYESPEVSRRKKPYALASTLGSVSAVKSKFNKAISHIDDIQQVIDTATKPIEEHVLEKNKNNNNEHSSIQPDHPETSQTNQILTGTPPQAATPVGKLAILAGVSVAAVIIISTVVIPVTILNTRNASNSEKSAVVQTVLPITASISSAQTSSFTTTTTITSTTTTTTTICPNISCSINPSVQNPSSNYQVEHLDINCTQSLTNLTIIQVVQRANNETYAQQYQTLWNNTTNMTYIQSQTNITYIWTLLPNMIINDTYFPYFTEAQYYHGNNSGRNTSNDTWYASFQSICNHTFTSFGIF